MIYTYHARSLTLFDAMLEQILCSDLSNDNPAILAPTLERCAKENIGKKAALYSIWFQHEDH
jgi:hypothetical protein